MPGRSTADALIDLKREVDAADEDYVRGIFIDIKGAFDNACHHPPPPPVDGDPQAERLPW